MRAIDIINYASKRILKRDIGVEDGVAWINDCLSTEIGKNALVFGEAELSNCKARRGYDLPSDYIAVRAVYDEQGEECDDWVADETQIRFGRAGTFTVKYHRTPIPVSIDEVETAVADCHPSLHSVIPYYLAYRFLNVDFTASKETEVRYLEFQSKLNEQLGQMQKRRRIIKTLPWM